MIITAASSQGGLDHVTTAVPRAADLHTVVPTLLRDGDDHRHATAWRPREKGFPYRVTDEVSVAHYARALTLPMIDTGPCPKQVDLPALSEGCDLLIIPAVPASLDTGSLVLTVQALQDIHNAHDRDCQRCSRGRTLA